VITLGIPIPDGRYVTRCAGYDRLEEMPPMASALLSDLGLTRGQVLGYSHRMKPARRFIVRKTADGERCWRTH